MRWFWPIIGGAFVLYLACMSDTTVRLVSLSFAFAYFIEYREKFDHRRAVVALLAVLPAIIPLVVGVRPLIENDVPTLQQWIVGLLAVASCALFGKFCRDLLLKLYDRWYPELITQAGIVTGPPLSKDERRYYWKAYRGLPLGYAHPIPKKFEFFGPLALDEATPLSYSGDRHLITFGPIGSGKNTTSQTPALLDWLNNTSALVIDPKGQLCALTTKQRRRMRHTIAALNPYDVLGIPSARYNPLDYLDPHAVTFMADCERIAEGIVDQSSASARTDHFQVSALDYVKLLIMWVKLFEANKSLVEVWHLLGLPDALRVGHCEKMATCGNAMIEEGAARYTSATSREVGDSVQTARVQASFLHDPAIQKILEGGANALSFAALKRQNMTVFLMLPPDLLKERGKFLRLMVFSAYSELIHEPTQPAHPVLFMLDEFAQLGHMPMIEQAASIVRDYKVRFWFILQNLPQLKDHYQGIWESFLSSAGVTQVFTPNDLTTAEYFSKRSGLKRRRRKSTSTSWSRGGRSSSVNYSDAEEPLYTPHDLMDMSGEEQLLICPGLSKGILAARMPYYKVKISRYRSYKDLADTDPYQMTTAERQAFEQKAREGKWYIDVTGLSHGS